MSAIKKPTKLELQRKNEELEIRLAEAEETLRAIYEGEVDAVVVSGTKGEQIFSLAGSDAIYRLIVETMKEAAVTVTFDGTILLANTQFGQFVGRPMEQIVGHALREFVVAEDKGAISALLSGARHEPMSHRFVFETPDVVRVPAHVSASFLRQQNSESICIVASDLTELENSTELIQKLRYQQEELQRTEEALRASEARFRSYFELGLIGVAVTSPTKGIIEVNDEVCRILGYERNELMQLTWADLTHPEDLASDVGQFNRVLAAEIDGYSINKRLIRKDGQIIDTTLSVKCLRRTDGSVDYFVALLQDITKHKRAQEENLQLLNTVQEEKDWLSALINSINDEIWFADAGKRFTLMNRAAAKEFGLGADAGMKVEDFAASLEVYRSDGTPRPVDEAPPLRALRGEVLKDEEEIVRMPAIAELRYRQISAAPVRGPNGAIIGSVSIVRDITERKRAEEAMQTTLQRFYLMLASMYSGVLLMTEEGRLEFVNQAFCDAYGLKQTPGELVGLPSRDFLDKIKPAFLHPDKAAGRIRDILQRGQPVVGEEFAMQDGRTAMRDYVPLNIRGKLHGRLWIHTDITERKRAEVELHEAKDELEIRVKERTAELEQTATVLGEEVVQRKNAEQAILSERQRFLDVLETLPVMIGLLTPDYQLQFANRAYREAFGVANGRKCFDYQFGRNDPCPECQAFLPLTTGQPHHWEWTVPDGRTIEIHNFPFMDGGGSPLILEMDVDITERRRAEKELRQAHENLALRAAQLRALAGELTLAEQRERRRMAKVLHDHLQQLLVAAKFRTTILGRAGDDVVGQGAKEVEQLLDNAIDTSRSLTAELSPPILHDAGLAAGLGWLARWMTDKHGLIIDLNIEDGLPQLKEDVRILLFESTRELLLNAVKHAHVRSASVNVRKIQETELQIMVSDSGHGFDPKQMKKAGELGGGFGLFSIRERLELIGARMEIDSGPGRGSRFILTCPLMQEPAADASLSAPAVSGSFDKMPITRPATGAKIRILLADDHKIMREGLIRLLGEEPDIEIAGEAADGEEAVRLAKELCPHIVLMDLSMPKLNGIDATRSIREKLPEVQVIGLSMFDEAESADSMYNAGAFAYLAKTGPTEALINAIRTCWAASQSSAKVVGHGATPGK